jgi:drug/metabolite transporter (DMT)-like permease
MRDSTIWLRLMLVAFLTNGLGPFGLKVLSERGLSAFQPQYLVAWYVGGLVFALIALGSGWSRLTRREVVLGAAMGLCSVGGQTFTGFALAREVPGHIVFPVTTGGSLFLVATAGMLIFHEKVGSYGLAGIALGILSLVMLSIP